MLLRSVEGPAGPAAARGQQQGGRRGGADQPADQLWLAFSKIRGSQCHNLSFSHLLTSTMSNEATLDELVDALKEVLHRRETLGRIRSKLRAEAFTSLRLAESANEEDDSKTKNEATPQPPIETVLINELIRDYLEFNGYSGTASVLAAEAGVGDNDGARLQRDLQKLELGVTERGDRKSNIPLLYGIVEALKKNKNAL